MDNEIKRGYLLEDFRIFHLRDALSVRVDSHYHEFHKLFMLCAGSGGYEIEGRRYRLVQGDLVLVGSGCVHCPDFGQAAYERIIMYISPQFLKRNSTADCDLERCFFGERGYVMRPSEERREQLFLLAGAVEREAQAAEQGHSILSRCMLLRLMVELARHTETGGAEMPPPMEPKDKKMLEIVRYLDAHYAEDMDIDGIAERFYISKYHMMRCFHAELGTSVHAYISERRLLAARDLIAKGCPATEACFRSGFGSYSSFSRAYMKLFGNTPTGRGEAKGRSGFIVE